MINDKEGGKYRLCYYLLRFMFAPASALQAMLYSLNFEV